VSKKGSVNGVGSGGTESDPESTGNRLEISIEPQAYTMGKLRPASQVVPVV